MVPNNLRESHRLLSGVYTLKNGQEFKGSLFAVAEKGTELNTKKLKYNSMIT